MSLEEPSTTPLGGTPQMVAGHKWIRGFLDGQVIVDSRDYQFVWEVPYWPWWFFSRAAIDGEIVPSTATDALELPPGAVRHDLVCTDRTLVGVARSYPDHPALSDLVTIDFGAMDRWFEEDVEVFVHPRSPYTRIDALASSRRVVVSINGVEVANSGKPTVLFETGAPARFYLPMTDIDLTVLTENRHTASCPYKGDSVFFDAHIGGDIVDDVAWSYTLPRPESAAVAGLVCFYDEKVDVDIDGVRQQRPVSHFA